MSEAFKAARNCYRDGRYRDACHAAFAALNDDPGNVDGVRLAALSLMRDGLHEAAKPMFRRALDLSPGNASVVNDLGRCFQSGGDHGEALRLFRQATVLSPSDVACTSNTALIHLNEGEFDASERWGRRAATINPSEPAVYDNVALSLLAKGRFAEGWALYERSIGIERREERVYGGELRWRGPEADAATVAMGGVPTRSLMVYGEQGVGDEILHSSCIPDVLANGPENVSIETHPGLVGLFQRSFPKSKVIGTRFEKVAATGLDARVSMAVLGQWYRRTISDYDRPAHLVADPERRAMVRGLLDTLPGLKVGVAWTGGTPATRKKVRSTTIEAIYNQLKHLPVTLVSLEYREPEISAYPKVRHFPWLVNTPDYDDTAALVAELDCVVSVTTAVAHLAGALGVPTFILAPDPPNWKYSVETNPGSQFYWWRSARLIRPRDGRWNLDPVREHLRKRAR
jgi:tetratricopeptide (TPR) repeat protein